MEEDGAGRLWVAPLLGGLKRLTWRPEAPSEPRIATFGEAEGLPGGILSVRSLGERLAVGGLEGVYVLQEDQRPPFRLSAPLADVLAGDEIVAISEGPSGHVWIYDGESVRMLRPEASGYRDVTPSVLHLHGARLLAIYEEADGTVWFGGESGLLRYDPRTAKDYAVPYAAQIRGVLGRPSDLLFGGAFGDGRLSSEQTSKDVLILPYERNGLRFEYAAPAYNLPEGTEFQYLLEGFEEAWSAWSGEDHTEFTNLPEHRNYRFRVRARNAQGVIGEEAVFAFRVLPPWYRTWWAYAIYLVGAGGLVWGISGWRLREHRRALESERMLSLRLERMNTRLAETNERLRRADKLKDDLLANTSHELRTPLTSILGFSSVLQEEGEEDQRELATAIHRSGQRLLDTVNGLLDMAKLQANLLELRPVELDLAEVARDVLGMLRPLAEERGLYLCLMPDDLAVPATADRYAFERILINLVSNAIKFTPSGGVTVLLDGTDEDVVLTVRDTGIGMDEAFLPHLFDAFKQASSGYSRSHEGSGLGLTIVKRVVELMGGRISVTSAVDEGTTFEVVMPRRTLAGGHTAGANRPFIHVSEPVLDGARLLAVVTDPQTQEELRRLVGDLCTLVVVDSPAEAVREAKVLPFDVVIVEDPGGAGGAVPQLRALPGYARVPAVILSAPAGGDGAPSDAEAEPADASVLALPLERTRLLHCLEMLLTRADRALAG